MKKIACLLLVLSAVVTSYAQSEKLVIGVMPFSSDVRTGYEGSITEKVVAILTETNRFTIVDRSSRDQVRQELETQKTEEFIDGEVVEQGASMGAKFIITGHIRDVSAQISYSADGSSNGYTANVDFTLKVVDVSTGQIMASQEFNTKGGSTLGKFAGSNPKSPENAVAKSLKNMGKKLKGFVNEQFPIEIVIAEISESKKGEAKVVLIAGGSSIGMTKNTKIAVKEVSSMEVNGKTLTRKKDIGMMKVISVEDENFSKCQVTSGGDQIMMKFTAGAKLFCTTVSK